MSAYYGKHGKPEVRKYKLHGRTKQSQKDETDINKLLERSARDGTLSHLEKYQAQYADYSDYDFETHVKTMANGQTMFEELPAEIKREFHQSPQEFFEFVNNPANSSDLPRLLPELANQGTQMPQVGVIQTRPTEEASEPETAPPADTTAVVGASLDTPTG